MKISVVLTKKNLFDFFNSNRVYKCISCFFGFSFSKRNSNKKVSLSHYKIFFTFKYFIQLFNFQKKVKKKNVLKY